MALSHLLFIDDVLCFCSDGCRDSYTLRDILHLFNKATRMEVNILKSTLYTSNMSNNIMFDLKAIFPFQYHSLNDGFKYLGFILKPNGHIKFDCIWLLAKVENDIFLWCNKWLSRGGRLILLKSILEEISIYWHTLEYIPKRGIG
jgi:hypothetical protein